MARVVIFNFFFLFRRENNFKLEEALEEKNFHTYELMMKLQTHHCMDDKGKM